MQHREFWECQFTFFPCKFDILFHFQKRYFEFKIVWNVYYSFSPYILGELTVKPAWSHGNSYIFYEVANSYDLTRTNSYDFC